MTCAHWTRLITGNNKRSFGASDPLPSKKPRLLRNDEIREDPDELPVFMDLPEEVGSPLEQFDLLMDAHHVDRREGRAATMRSGKAKLEEASIDVVLQHAGVLEAGHDERQQRHLSLSDMSDSDAVHDYIRFSRTQSNRAQPSPQVLALLTAHPPRPIFCDCLYHLRPLWTRNSTLMCCRWLTMMFLTIPRMKVLHTLGFIFGFNASRHRLRWLQPQLMFRTLRKTFVARAQSRIWPKMPLITL